MIKNKKNNDGEISIATRLVHAGEKPDLLSGALAPVLVRSKTFKQSHFRVEAEYQYGRGKNPTRAALEEKLAKLEQLNSGNDIDIYAAVFSSGNAAFTNLLLTLTPGDHILFGKEVYGGTFRIIENVFKKFGIKYEFVDFSDGSTENFKDINNRITNNTKYLFVEAISNPSLHVADLNFVQKVSKESGVPFIMDGTFLPPNAIQYFDYGAEAILYSLSKYFAGHNDVIGGAIVTKNQELYEKLKGLQRAVGAVLSPDEAYRVLQGIKTLDLRWKKVSESALTVAKLLESNPKIRRVTYPLSKSHLDYETAKNQFKNGAGGVVSFELKTNNLVEVQKFVESVTQNGIITYAESLASPQTILAYPAWMSHRALPESERLSLGISDSFFRLSLGFEDVEDVVAELQRGLNVL